MYWLVTIQEAINSIVVSTRTLDKIHLHTTYDRNELKN